MKKKKEHDAWEYLRVKDENKIPVIETYNLSVATTLFIAPRLRVLVEGITNCGATPIDFIDRDSDGTEFGISMENLEKASNDWNNKLLKMQYAFDSLEKNISKTRGIFELNKFSKEQRSKIEEGLSLFAKHYCDLWY